MEPDRRSLALSAEKNRGNRAQATEPRPGLSLEELGEPVRLERGGPGRCRTPPRAGGSFDHRACIPEKPASLCGEPALERLKGFEPSTSTLATDGLLPRSVTAVRARVRGTLDAQ